MASPLARSDLHSAVQPPVKALGNQARTTALPFRAARLCTLPSEPGSENAGAVSPSFSSTGACQVAAAAVSDSDATHVSIRRVIGSSYKYAFYRYSPLTRSLCPSFALFPAPAPVPSALCPVPCFPLEVAPRPAG